jgi:superfamily II helicase
MTQELTDLRAFILEGRYEDALSLVDELEGMSKKAILQNIENFLSRMLNHLIKNQIEQRLTNSWSASIRDSLLKIQSLNFKENKSFFYINQDEWESCLENSFEDAIFAASVKFLNGNYTPFKLQEMVNKTEIIVAANKLLNLTYFHSARALRDIISEELSKLPGGEEWKIGR